MLSQCSRQTIKCSINVLKLLLTYTSDDFVMSYVMCDPNVVPKSPKSCVSLPQKLLEAHEEQNSDAFTEAVKEFDSVSRLDQWLTTMLLRIKKTIQGDGGDLK